MKILVIIPQANQGGGAENMIENFLLGISENRPDVEISIVALRDGPFVGRVEKLGFTVSMVRNLRLSRPWSCMSALLDLRRLCKRFSPDVIFSWVAYAHVFGGLVGMFNRIPEVWYQIGFAEGFLDQFASCIPSRGILTVSEHISERQRMILPFWLKSLSVRTVHPGIDLTAYEKAASIPVSELREKLEIPLDAKTAVIVGRLQSWKGIHTVIQAMPKVLNAIPTAQLYIVGGQHSGEPSYRAYLESLINDRSLGQSVHLMDLQTNVPEWMRSCDVVIHASKKEPLGIVAIEGMASGTAMITGSDGGVTEVARNGKEGLHVAFENTECMAKALIDLFSDDGLRKQLGKRGRLRARTFSRKKYAMQILNFLEDVSRRKN